MTLLAEIREKQPFARVIMVSGYAGMEIQRKAFREYLAFDFFRKEQFDTDEFRKSFKEAVEDAARERQAWKDSNYASNRRFALWRKDNPEG